MSFHGPVMFEDSMAFFALGSGWRNAVLFVQAGLGYCPLQHLRYGKMSFMSVLKSEGAVGRGAKRRGAAAVAMPSVEGGGAGVPSVEGRRQ
jgi:hypothetical protein